ncbi:MAG: glycosyltransferase [Alphaproteobacteria bacterium]|nr:glycosyltransferase [Alphaproteobacteria bacterium]
MRIVVFAHSLVSCWNHGNAHFLRGITRELLARTHEVRVFEPVDGWSRVNLLADHGAAPFERFARDFPELRSTPYGPEFDLTEATHGADLVIAHEWTDPSLVAALGRQRKRGARFTLLFHDTHHRGVSDPAALDALDLTGFDGVLAFGASLAEVYRKRGWGARAFVWHEAADTRLFRPPANEGVRAGAVWIGNWGDGERTRELREFLLEPVARAGLLLDVHGVRYPEDALASLVRFSARYHGWLPNARAPEVFARHMATVHVPRRYYANALPGIPTIRVFEALACGIPLLSAPWQDSEELFRPGQDYLVAKDGDTMHHHLRALTHDPGLRASLAASGLETIRSRHTCAHRVSELLRIVAQLREPVAA